MIVFAVTQLTGSDAAEPPSAGGADASARRRRRRPKPLASSRAAAATILPDFRVVAFYGAPQDTQLGALGIGTPGQAARKLERAGQAATRASRARCCRRWS